jgi:hypothetical protein
MEKTLAEKISLVGRCYTLLAPEGMLVALAIQHHAGGYPTWTFMAKQNPQDYRGRPIEKRKEVPEFELSMPMFEEKPGWEGKDDCAESIAGLAGKWKPTDPTVMVDECLLGIYKATRDYVAKLARGEKVNAMSREYLESIVRDLERMVVG